MCVRLSVRKFAWPELYTTLVVLVFLFQGWPDIFVSVNNKNVRDWIDVTMKKNGKDPLFC